MNIKFNIFLFFITISNFCYSQGTEDYNYIINQLIPVRTETIVEKYKNGNLKRMASITYYNVEGEEHGVYTGKYVKYLKDGGISLERENDLAGSPLIVKVYYKGELLSTKKTIELNTNSKKIDVFLFQSKNTSMICEYEGYELDENGESNIMLKGVLINDKRSGLWVRFNNGKIKKTKNYKGITRFERIPKTKHIKA